jgi:hypothetical protein
MSLVVFDYPVLASVQEIFDHPSLHPSKVFEGTPKGTCIAEVPK